MIDSDQSDKESQDEMPTLEVSNDSVNCNEPGQKRSREENSEDDNLHVPPKKLCTSVGDTTSEELETECKSEINGAAENMEDNTKDTSVNNVEEKVKSLSEESANKTAKESNIATNEAENNEISSDNGIAIKKDSDSNVLTTAKEKEHESAESITSNAEDTPTKEEADKGEDDKTKLKEKHKKSQIGDAEVVEGLELSVECASDKESSSSDSEDGKNIKPVPKTIIVKAKPNDSELDVSSSEAERSDSQEQSEVKTKQTAKKGKKKGRTSFTKAKGTDSEENNDNVSDEDYSPRTKRKLKKTVANKKSTKSPTRSRKGRGKVKEATKKSSEKEDEEDENSNIAEEKDAEENVSDIESVKTRSDDESDSADASKDGSGKRRSSKAEDNKKIQILKKYIRTAGIHVKSYNDLWADCKSNAAKVRCLKELLEKHGVNGRPTVEKCKKAKQRNERLKDVAELNTSNIISEGRVTRAQRNKDPIKESTKSLESPTKRTYKRVLSVIDSDSE